MAFLDTIRRWLGREAREARETLSDAEQRLDAALTRRERELEATPEERLDMTQDEIAASDAEYEALKAKLEASSEVAEAGDAAAGPPAEGKPRGGAGDGGSGGGAL